MEIERAIGILSSDYVARVNPINGKLTRRISDSQYGQLIEKASQALSQEIGDLQTNKPQTKSKKETEQHIQEAVKTAKRSLILNWSDDIYKQYSAIPDDKDHQQESLQFLSRLDTYLIEQLQDPELMAVILNAWQSRLLPGQQNSRKVSVDRYATQLWKKELRRSWESITPEQLAGMVKEYSQNQISGNEFGEIIRAYFEAQQSIQDSVNAFYKFGQSIFLLMENPTAFRRAAMIVNFQDERVIGMNHAQHINFVLATQTLILDEEKEAFKQIHILDKLFIDLAVVTGLDEDKLRSSFLQFNQKNGELQKQIHARYKNLCKVIGKTEVDRRLYNISQLIAAAQIKSAVGLANNVLFDGNDPLAQQHIQLVRMRAHEIRMRKNLKAKMRGGELTTILLPDGLVADISIPTHLFTSRPEIQLYARPKIENQVNPEKVPWLFGDASYLNVGYRSEFEFNRSNVAYVVRRRGQIGELHPIVGMEKYGFPEPKVNDSITDELEKLQKRIYSAKTRFVDRRGIRIQVQEPELIKRGYQNIVFKKSDEDPRKIDITVQIGSILYDVSLDRYFNFAFNGKATDSTDFENRLRYWLLRVLDPVLTVEAPEEIEQGSTDREREVITVMGHFMRIGKKGYTSDAVKKFALYEGDDLPSAIRLWKAAHPHITDNITYRSPVDKRKVGQHLDPLDIETGVRVEFTES